MTATICAFESIFSSVSHAPGTSLSTIMRSWLASLLRGPRRLSFSACLRLAWDLLCRGLRVSGAWKLLFAAALAKAVHAAISTIWNLPQVRISQASTEAAMSMEKKVDTRDDIAAGQDGKGLSELLDSEDSGPLMVNLAAQAFAGVSRSATRRSRITAFYRHWISRARLEFPLRADRASDKGAMSKWLAAELKATGMRATHIADAVPRVVALAINPSRAEVEAAQWAERARLRTLGEGWLYSLRDRGLAALGLSAGLDLTPPPGFD